MAHNASFDKRFLDVELKRISRGYKGRFTCSLLLARRLYQQAPNHKLGSLINYKGIPSGGGFHKALFDSEMTAKLWLAMLTNIKRQTRLAVIPFSLIEKPLKVHKKNVATFLAND